MQKDLSPTAKNFYIQCGIFPKCRTLEEHIAEIKPDTAAWLPLANFPIVENKRDARRALKDFKKRLDAEVAKKAKDLGDALAEAEENGENISAINMIRLLIFTGCRRGEVQTLKWDYIDWEKPCINFPDSKTGEKILPLSPPAIGILKKQAKVEGNPYVFHGGKDGQYFVGLTKVWNKIKSRKQSLQGVRIHDLRHSFASVGVNSGHSLLLVGSLLGHSNPNTTSRYAHLSDDPRQATLEEITGLIESYMA